MQATKLQPESYQMMQAWAGRLRQWRLHQFAAALLEAGGPLKLIGAQLVFISQPLFSALLTNDHLDALAEMLEKPDRTNQFIEFLREEQPE